MSAKVRFQDYVARVAEEAGVGKQAARGYLGELVDLADERLMEDGEMDLLRLGVFKLKWSEKRNGRNPNTGESIEIPAHSRVVFIPRKPIRDHANAKYADLQFKVLEEEISKAEIDRHAEEEEFHEDYEAVEELISPTLSEKDAEKLEKSGRKIRFREFARRVAEESGTNQALARSYFRELAGLIEDQMMENRQFRLNKLGVFKISWIEERKGTNPQNGETLDIPGHGRALYSPAKPLKEHVNKPYEDLQYEILEEEVPEVPPQVTEEEDEFDTGPVDLDEYALLSTVGHPVPLINGARYDAPVAPGERAIETKEEVDAAVEEWKQVEAVDKAEAIAAEERITREQAGLEAKEKEERKAAEKAAQEAEEEEERKATEAELAAKREQAEREAKEEKEERIAKEKAKEEERIAAEKAKDEAEVAAVLKAVRELAAVATKVADAIPSVPSSRRNTLKEPEAVTQSEKTFSDAEATIASDLITALRNSSQENEAVVASGADERTIVSRANEATVASRTDEDPVPNSVVSETARSLNAVGGGTESVGEGAKKKTGRIAAIIAVVVIVLVILFFVFKYQGNQFESDTAAVAPLKPETVDPFSTDPEPTPAPELEPPPESDPEPTPALEPGPPPESDPEPTPAPEPGPPPESDLEPTPAPESEPPPESDPEPIPEPRPEVAPQATEGSIHKVVNGDTLWDLAHEWYGDKLLWPQIYATNKDIVKNPDFLKPGQTIRIPSLEGGPENLTDTDRREIASGYVWVYRAYKKRGQSKALQYLKKAYQINAATPRRFQNQIDKTDYKSVVK